MSNDPVPSAFLDRTLRVLDQAAPVAMRGGALDGGLPEAPSP